MQNIESEQVFKVGTQVEVARNGTYWRKSWHKATVISPPPNPNNFGNSSNGVWVEYETIFDNAEPTKKLQELTNTLLIRPLPPILTQDSKDFEKYDVVDAYHKDGWVPGVILDVINDGNVAFHPSNVGETVVASLVESTRAVDSPGEQTPSPSKKLKHKGDAEGRPSSELQYSDGDCGSKTPVLYSDPAANECLKARPITICYSRRPNKRKKWPFPKRSSIWKVVESLEVFKRFPQRPHFFPLRKLEENSREMLAICLMMDFSYIAERISAGFPDDLNSSITIQDTLKSLEEFESHGFNIAPLQNYLTEVLLKVKMEKELKGNLEEIDCKIIKCQDEKTTVERKLSELAKQLKSLQEQIQLEKSVKYLKDRHHAILVSHRGIISRKLHSFQLTMKPAFKW